MMKRIIATLLMLAMILAMIPATLAADAEHSQVWRDLASMEFDGEPWDSRDYPADSKDSGVYVVAVDEVGFRKNGDLSGYAFYLYLYNPSGETFRFENGSTVQMAVAWNEDGTPKEYEKFDLRLVSASDEAGYHNVYLKVSVVDHPSGVDGSTMKQRLLKTKSRRLYDISGVELALPDGTIYDHAYGCSVIVRGYDAGLGEGNEASTKEITYTPATTLTLDVRHAYWRTQTSSKGVNHKHQINSAYFTVPGEVWEQYKELYSIKCTWEEHKTTPMIVTDDQALYDSLLPYCFAPLEYFLYKPEYRLYSQYDVHYGGGGVFVTMVSANYAYNPLANEKISNNISTLGWLFKAKNEIKLNQQSISADEVLAYEGREQWRNGMTIYLDTTFDLSNYDSNHNWFQKIADYNWFNGGAVPGKGLMVDTDEIYDNFEPITVFEPNNGNGQYIQSATASAVDMTDKYFFHDAFQAQEFLTYTEDALDNGDVVVLFRYASTDYFSESFTVYPEIDGHAYVATQTFFKNFDVIQLQFKKEDMSISTLAIVNDPDNVGSGLDSPTTSTDSDLVKDQLMEQWRLMLDDMSQMLKWVLGIVILCALIPLFVKAFELMGDILSGEGRKAKNSRPRGRQRGSTRRQQDRGNK